MNRSLLYYAGLGGEQAPTTSYRRLAILQAFLAIEPSKLLKFKDDRMVPQLLSGLLREVQTC